MPRTASKPGPPLISCLTCHRRRKKCDQSRPYCERCRKGGYECLGYEDNKPTTRARPDNPSAPTSSHSRSVPLAPGSEIPDSATTMPQSGDRQDSFGINPDDDHSGPPILGAALLYRMSGPASLANEDCTPVESSEEFDRSWPQEHTQLVVYSHPRTRQSSCARRVSDTPPDMKSSVNDTSGVIQTIRQSIPRSVDATQIMREDSALRVLSTYYAQRIRFWFMTPPDRLRGALTSRFKVSKVILWAMYLGIGLLEALGQDPSSMAIRGYIGWIDKLERNIATVTNRNLSMSDVSNRLMAQLEVVFLKFIAVDNTSGYALLQKSLAWFLQLVATDPNLYMEGPNGNLVVSFSRTLCAPRQELQRFVIYDTVAVLLLGVPPLVEYGYDGEYSSSSYIFEWIHGIPVTLIEVVSQVNSWRANSRAPLADWKSLESRVLAWQPPAVTGERISVGRAAVQEGWRHVVLIYIYMGICSVSSHDSRVQASVDQIIELGETVADLPIGMHMFTHCVVAGLAARFERHRVQLYEKIVSFKDTRAWLFRGPQFGQVLYHLWRGVGEGGSPVVWDDYVRSRCAVAPI